MCAPPSEMYRRGPVLHTAYRPPWSGWALGTQCGRGPATHCCPCFCGVLTIPAVPAHGRPPGPWLFSLGVTCLLPACALHSTGPGQYSKSPGLQCSHLVWNQKPWRCLQFVPTQLYCTNYFSFLGFKITGCKVVNFCFLKPTCGYCIGKWSKYIARVLNCPRRKVFSFLSKVAILTFII